jgi:hypothetical protein
MELPRLDRRTQFSNPAVGRVPGQAPAMGTGALATGVSQAVDAIGEVKGRDAARAARAELAGLEAGLNEIELKLIHDPTTGARSKKGRDAQGLPAQYLPQFDEAAKELRGRASNDVVGAALDELVARRRASLAEGLASYSAGEAEKFYDTESVAQIQSFADLAGRNAADPRRVTEAAERAEWAANDMISRKGLGPEAAAQARLEARSSVFRSQIQGLLADGRYADANKAFLGADLTAKDREALDSAVRTGVVRSEARTKADEIIAAGGGVSAWRDRVKDIQDPDVRAQVKDYIDEEWSDREALRQQGERDATNAAANFIDAGQEVPPHIWAAVPGTSKSGLRAVIKARQRGETIATDPKVYDEVYRGLTSNDPAVRAAWMKKDLTQYWGSLDASDRESFTKLQVAVGNPNSPENRALVADFQTQQDVIDVALENMGLPTTPAARARATTSDREREEAAMFSMEVGRRVTALQQSLRRKATPEEVQTVVDSVVKKVATQGLWTPGETEWFRVRAEEVPSKFVAKARREAQAEGVEPPTPDEILELYKRELMRGQQ